MSEQEKLIFKNVKAHAAQARARSLVLSTRKMVSQKGETKKKEAIA